MPKITVYKSSMDGFQDQLQFDDLADARRWAQEYAGERVEFGPGYAISSDGVAQVRVSGASLRDLFPGCE